jgi:hypothetical protein
MASLLERAYAELHSEATRLAGGLTDVAQRATVYRQIYRFSGGNHVFPLIAAHGALWSGGYFRAAHRLAIALSWQYIGRPALRQQQLRRLEDFENTLRDINRRVCIDTYVNLHLTARYGAGPETERFVPAPLREAMARLHCARQAGAPLSDAEKRLVFEAHFRNEQEHVVGPTLTAAVAQFDWPLVRQIALRPPIRFAYFSGAQCLLFRNFANAQERIAQGLLAFEYAAACGWQRVEAVLEHYGVLPREAFAQPDLHFDKLCSAILVSE